MAHFAQLNQINTVIQVIVVHNNELVVSKQTSLNEDGSVSVSVIESEDKGIEFCKSLFGADTNWVQTSYNGNFRGKYAAIGDTYDPVTNLFVSPVVEPAPVTTPVVESVPVVDAPQVTTMDLPALTSEQISGL